MAQTLRVVHRALIYSTDQYYSSLWCIQTGGVGYPRRRCGGTRAFQTAEEEGQEAELSEEEVNVFLVDYSEDHIPVKAKVVENVLYLEHKYEINLDGACKTSMAFSTCQVHVSLDSNSKLSDPDVKEGDVLDMAPLAHENSWLGCQINLTKELERAEFTLPKITRNSYVDGHVPKRH